MGYRMDFKHDPAWIASKLHSKREIDTVSGCWIWTGTRHRGGYGIIMIHGVKWRVHRLAAVLWKDFDNDTSRLVCHHCDRPSCFNPDHLFLGSVADNNADKMTKGRGRFAQCGDPRLGQKLSASDIPVILQRVRAGQSRRAVGEAYGVSGEAIRLVEEGITWRHVSGIVRPQRRT